MEIAKENCIDWKNGVSQGAPTYLNADNLNKVNIKTQEALTLLDTKVADDFAEFEDRLVNANSKNPIIVAETVQAEADGKGNIISEYYATKDSFNELTSNLKDGALIVKEAVIANTALRVTGTISGNVKVTGAKKVIGTKDSTLATTEFVTETFERALNDALE